jgi:hypothetical protein
LSWEEDFTKEYPCPCGKGGYEYTSYSDDWGRSKTEYNMLCPECREKYTYSSKVIYGHPGNEVERGWVLKSVLEAEGKREIETFNKVKVLYYDLWVSKFGTLKSKKSMWELLTQNGKYNPSLGTFYAHTKGYTREELINHINWYFNPYNYKRIFEVSGVTPDCNSLGLVEI